MLIPRRVKHRKQHHPTRRGVAKGGTEVTFGSYGLQALEPAYSRGGFDYFSTPIEPPQTRTVPTQCELQLGKHTEVQKLETTYRCSVTTLSEPRLPTDTEISRINRFFVSRASAQNCSRSCPRTREASSATERPTVSETRAP